VHEAEAFLELIVRHTDSSLLDEWQNLKDGATTPAKDKPDAAEKLAAFKAKIPFTKDNANFTRQLRNHLLTLVTALSPYQTETALGLVEPADSDGKPWTHERLLRLLDEYHEARERIRLDPEARNARHTHTSDDGLT